MEYQRDESAKWSKTVNTTVMKLANMVDKALTENAARGFPESTGPILQAILDASLEVKLDLTEADGKLYAEQRERIFQQEEFTLNVLIKVAKLAMELYREELMNALAIEQQEAEQLRDQGKADVERMNAETDFRQVAIITARADMELRITGYKARLIEAEAGTLSYEEALINAQLVTAEKKLEIIASIYKVLAAEQLVLAAEQRRAAALELVLVARMIVAGIKREMIPFYLQKADAKMVLAQAITDEIPVRRALEELGYDRIALKDAEEAARHVGEQGQLEYELAKEAWIRANKATEIAKAQSRRLLQEYANLIHADIMAKKKELQLMDIDFKLDTSLSRVSMGVADDIQLSVAERANLTAEIASLSAGITARGQASAAATASSAKQSSKSTTDTLLSRRVKKGFIVG